MCVYVYMCVSEQDILILILFKRTFLYQPLKLFPARTIDTFINDTLKTV